jgi:hypothetical protein
VCCIHIYSIYSRYRLLCTIETNERLESQYIDGGHDETRRDTQGLNIGVVYPGCSAFPLGEILLRGSGHLRRTSNSHANSDGTD